MAADLPADLKRTPLTDWHEAHGGKLVPFAGYAMPVQYAGVLAEHAAVRERVGLFDITHMGEIHVDGPGAEAWLDGLVTNRVAGIPVGKVVYNAMCRDDGGVLDDMLIYRLAPERWLVVCNASNHDKIAAWLAARARGAAGVKLDDASDRTALIAVQGPAAWDLTARITALLPHRAAVEALEFYTAVELKLGGSTWVVSRTGYTGERGYEIYVPNADALALWEELLHLGRDLGVAPIGLAARDTLRFEMAYCLYGHELAEEVTPLEAGIGWAVKLNKPAFVGRDALIRQRDAGVPRRLIGVSIGGRAIARQGAPVLSGGRPVGAVTSGTFSPTLQCALALALVETAAAGGPLEVDVRGKRFPLTPTPYPFLAARVKGDPRAARS
ncbi:MAG: glycine cleavage system aminomethyltransferase GcvT [Candidatus Krumholzibacteriia bacterium]